MPTMTKETHWSVYNVVSSARSDVTFLPPATNLRQGNIFTRMWQGGAWWGGGMGSRGHTWQERILAGEACVAGGHVWWGEHA